MADVKRPEHQAIATALRATDLLVACKCWFGGGTEIVLELGEYRLSRKAAWVLERLSDARERGTTASALGMAGGCRDCLLS